MNKRVFKASGRPASRTPPSRRADDGAVLGMSHAPTGSHTGLEPVLSSLGVGRSGRATLVQLGLVSASAGALIQALTITSACAATEWGVGADRAGRLKVAMIGGEVFGAFLWCCAGDAVGRREACCLSCVLGAGGIVICAFAASFDVLVAATATVGCAVAGATLAPVVLAVERAPARFRGRYAASLALFGTGGAAAAALAHAVIAAGVAAARAALGDDASAVGAQWRSSTREGTMHHVGRSRGVGGRVAAVGDAPPGSEHDVYDGATAKQVLTPSCHGSCRAMPVSAHLPITSRHCISPHPISCHLSKVSHRMPPRHHPTPRPAIASHPLPRRRPRGSARRRARRWRRAGASTSTARTARRASGPRCSRR